MRKFDIHPAHNRGVQVRGMGSYVDMKSTLEQTKEQKRLKKLRKNRTGHYQSSDHALRRSNRWGTSRSFQRLLYPS